jgi:hypothetical protein
MVNEFVLCRSALMNGLLQSIQNKPSIGCAACPPSDNPARKYIYDESDVDKALPRREWSKKRRCASPHLAWSDSLHFKQLELFPFAM